MNYKTKAIVASGLAVTALLAVGSGVTPALAHTVAPNASSSKTLVIGSEQAPPTLDPTANAAAAIDEVVDYNVLQHLVQLAPDGKIVPVLATGYTVSANRLVYTFTIRQGVKFSNGDPLTPADVVYSINRVTAKKYPYAAIFDVASAATVGTDQVAVTLQSPSWSFLFNLASYSNGVIVDPKAVSTLGTAPVGTGPYEVTGQVANYSVSLKANPTYWGTTPGAASIEFRYFTDSNAEDAALEDGQIQVIDNLSSPDEASTFTANPSKYGVIGGLTNGKVQLTINNTAGPFANKLVRQAVNYAIDKQAVIQVASAGLGKAIGSDTVPSDPYYVNLADLYPYNPSKAKQLLAKAGYPHGFSTTLTLPPYFYAQLAAPVIQSELDAIGINVTIQNIAWPLWLSRVFEGGNFDLTIIDHAEARDIANYATKGYYWHFAGTAQVAKQLAAANAAPTQQQWIAGTRAVVREIANDAVNDWLYALPVLEVHLKGVIGLPTGGYTESFDLQYVRLGGQVPASAVALGYSDS
jgi:peptide/nickel transport system substrate-binding protein